MATKSDVDQKLLNEAFKRCEDLLHNLMKHQHGSVFNSPVDVRGRGLKGYYKIVKHPMDLGTVRTRLEKERYLSPVQLARDIKLTFNNAVLFNNNGGSAYDMANELLEIFLKEWSSIKADFASLLSIDDMAFGLCRRLLNQLMGHQHGRFFHKLDVDLPGYNQIVRRPMDFVTIDTKLEKEEYSSPLEFVEDVKLTFYNAVLYHDEKDAAYTGAKELLEVFNKEWAPIKAEFEPFLDDDYMVNKVAAEHKEKRKW